MICSGLDRSIHLEVKCFWSLYCLEVKTVIFWLAGFGLSFKCLCLYSNEVFFNPNEMYLDQNEVFFIYNVEIC